MANTVFAGGKCEIANKNYQRVRCENKTHFILIYVCMTKL